MHMRSVILTIVVVCLAIAGCAKENPEVKEKLVKGGLSSATAAELSTMDLTAEEITNLVAARSNGLDDASLVDMVRTMHDDDLKFVIGDETQLLMKGGMGTTAITQLVKMGAIPRWSDDLRSLKEFGVGDVTVIEIAKLRFVENKEVLSGGEYARLKQFGMSDAGLLDFARRRGSPQQLEVVAEELAKGKPEKQAMQSAGFK